MTGIDAATRDPGPPDVDEAERAMLAVEAWVAAWLRDRVRFLS